MKWRDIFIPALMQASCLPWSPVAPNQAFLNIDEFFHFLAPTVPFILGRLGIPIFGNKAIPSWLWHSSNDHFFLFLSQAENDLPPHRQRFSGTEPDPVIEERTWLYTLLLPLSLALSFYVCTVTVFGDSFSYSISVISNLLIFHHQPYPCTAFLPVPHLHFLYFSFFPMFQMIPRYSSYSPEGALIPRFPPQSTDRFKRVLRRPWQNRFTSPW